MNDINELTPVTTPVDQLERVVGLTQARAIMGHALHDGTLPSIAARFVSSGVWRHRGMGGRYDLPEEASDYLIPAPFWHGFDHIGEERQESRGLRVILNADWIAGNFSFRHETADGVSERAAFNVRLPMTAANALVARYTGSAVNITPDSQRSEAKPRGRSKGSGSFAAFDAPLVDKMREILAGPNPPSIHAVSLQFAGQATGGGTEESKAKRLRGRLEFN